MKPEDLLHLLAPYLPTDRFRALLRKADLPPTGHGAALLADISGFTPLTTALVAEYGPQRASEELKRRVNPMFEAIAGQVFHHGGSVIRFLGDGFTAWFDDQPVGFHNGNGTLPFVPGVLRAAAAALEMQATMPLFRGLRLKISIGAGEANRWVVGQPMHGLADILSGPAVQAMVSLTGMAQPGEVLIHADAVPLLDQHGLVLRVAASGSAVLLDMPAGLSSLARRYRWPAWQPEGTIAEILEAVRPYVDASIRERVEGGLGDYVGELRSALPMFLQVQTTPDADPRTVLNNYVCAVQDMLATFGGRLVSVEVSDKGSVLFTVFGAPVSYGDDAERALRVALNLREVVRHMDGIASQCVGISRGLLYAGTVGGEVRHEYSTIGDETNIAARLMVAAEAGQILASSAVRKQAGPRIVFRELPPVAIKGRSEPIPVAEPIAIRSGQARQMKGSKFVGREAELGRLTRLLRAVVVGHGRVARIEGDAGIGKSRLAAELAVLAADQKVRVVRGDCVSTGGHVAYLPWQELLRALFGLNSDGSVDAGLRTLSEVMHRIAPRAMPRLPLLGDVLDLPIADTPTTATLTGQTRQQAIFALVTELIQQMARRQPLVLILDDVQWLDEISEALTIDLVRRLSVESAPLLLLLMHRPALESEHLHRLIATLDGLHFYSHIPVSELSRIDVTRLLEKQFDAIVPPELAHFVYERSQGNPFFVQEMIDTLLETGYVQVESVVAAPALPAVSSGTAVSALPADAEQTSAPLPTTRLEVVRPLSGADLPDTVQGLIQARIDRLHELDKLVLKVAAVIGREFQVRVLEGSIPVPMPREQLLGHLHTLEAREFSYLASTEPDVTYLFKHAITQEVTYQSLLFDQRRQLHQAVATTLETLVPDAVERLAYHFVRGGDVERARHYLIAAGQKTFRDYANQAALDYFTQALALARDDTERFEINGQRVQVLLRLGDTQAVHSELEAMQQLADRHERVEWQAAVHIFWADYYTQTSAWADAIREAQQAVNYAESIDDDALAWRGYLLLRGAMLSLNQRGQVARADLDRKMQAIAERLGDQRHVIELILTWFDDLYSEGPEIAIQGAQTALSRATELQDPVLEAQCWSVLADLFIREYALPDALAAARQEIGLLRQIGDRRREGLTLNRIGSVLLSLGQLGEANTHLLDAYRLLHQIGERSGEAASLLYLGMAAEYYQAYEEASAYIQRALTAQRSLNAAVDVALSLYYLGNVCLSRGAVDEAAAAFQESRGILEAHRRVRYILSIAEVDSGLAAVELRRDQPAAALERMNAMIIRLGRSQISGLFLPGLAALRALEVLEANGDAERTERVRDGYRRAMAPTLEWLTERGWLENFVTSLPYNRFLLG